MINKILKIVIINLLLSTSLLYGYNKPLKLYNIHTGEKLIIDNLDNIDNLSRLDYFMRDYRKDISIEMDRNLYKLLNDIYQKSNSDDYIEIISGYRTEDTNSSLRKISKKVAKKSQHTLGKAIDFRIRNYSLDKLKNIAISMKRGGVGYYPQKWNRFIHIDTGRVRAW